MTNKPNLAELREQLDARRDPIKQAVRSVLIEERIMSSLEAHLPPPSDIEAELVVLGGLVSGEIDPQCADALEPGDFFVPLYRWVFSKFKDGARTVEELQALSIKEGMHGPRIEGELDALQWQAVVCVPPPSLWVARIIEASRKRGIFNELRNVSLKLACGDMTADEARQVLRRVVL